MAGAFRVDDDDEPDLERKPRALWLVVLNIAVTDRLTDAANLLENQSEVENVQDKNGVLVVKLNKGVHQYGFLANRLIEQGFELTLFKEDEINLETAFMHLTIARTIGLSTQIHPSSSQGDGTRRQYVAVAGPPGCL